MTESKLSNFSISAKAAKAFLSMLLCLTFILQSTTMVQAREFGTINNDEAVIRELFDARAEILSRHSVNMSLLNAIDVQLLQLGVEFLTAEQVRDQFPEVKANRYLALSGQTQIMKPMVQVPVSNVNTWASFRTSNYLHNGLRYNIQHLVAQPILNSSSPLLQIYVRVLTYNTNW